jgi:hypothetical protein
MSSFGFTQEPTPGDGVRDFYRLQGRQLERDRIVGLVDLLQLDCGVQGFEVLSNLVVLIESRKTAAEIVEETR